ncbi:hypothetical protein RvY_15344 [Ramazzottius varieornatus]|uniref:DRBM domain-containing protein n=1 Tax=Ramazzottius varieornatus TaxID=947166 RepID=A0A1D1W1F0_RAMVA|nr:hypothetical protein RvY_15344 [Ramazzottius varieornatus]
MDPFYAFSHCDYWPPSGYPYGRSQKPLHYAGSAAMGYSYAPSTPGLSPRTHDSIGIQNAASSLLGDYPPTFSSLTYPFYPQYSRNSPVSTKGLIDNSTLDCSSKFTVPEVSSESHTRPAAVIQQSPDVSNSFSRNSSQFNGGSNTDTTSGRDRIDDSASVVNHADSPVNRLLRLARYNKVRLNYELLNEKGPAHMKVFTAKVTLLRGRNIEAFCGEGSTIKLAQHNAASKALLSSTLQHLPEKLFPRKVSSPSDASAVTRLNSLAIKMRSWADYTDTCSRAVWSFEGNVWNTTVTVSGKQFDGYGASKVCSRNMAAQQALEYFDFEKLRKAQEAFSEESVNGAVENASSKSPITKLYETARRICIDVKFDEESSEGVPHCQIHYVRCVSGEMAAIGKGANKKLARNNAAEQMLKQFQQAYPAFTDDFCPFKNPNKSKKAKIVKLNKVRPDYGQNINPVSRLHQIQQAKNAPDPIFECADPNLAGKEKEFTVIASVQEKDGLITATGSGPNKRLAKRFAAENLLRAMGHQTQTPQPQKPTLRALKEPAEEELPGTDRKVTFEQEVPENGDKQNGRTYRKRFSKKPQPAYMYPKDNVQEVIFEASLVNQVVRPGRTIVPGVISLPQSNSPDKEAVGGCNVGEISALAKMLLTTRKITEESSEASSALALLEHLCRVVNLTLKKDGFSKQGPHAKFVTVLTVAEPVQSIGCGNGATEEQALQNAALNLLTVIADHGWAVGKEIKCKRVT